MDLKLLERIFQTPARSRAETQMADVIRDVLTQSDVPFATDEVGNVYSLNQKNVPLLSAHMDTVQDEVDAALAKFAKIRGNILSGYGVIGGDDKCGIFIALTFAMAGMCNFVFSTEEEVGGNGIKHFVNKQDLSHIPYGLVLDRRGYKDIICTKNNYGVEAFEKMLIEIGKVYKYEQSSGIFSDANYISEQISCANLSVGYYNPHSKSEFVNLLDLKNALNFTNAIIKNVKEKFSAPSKTVYRYFGYGTTNNYNKRKASISAPATAQETQQYLGEYCMFCNARSQKTIYSKVCNDFICLDCMAQLRDEIFDYEDVLPHFNDVEDFNMTEEQTDKNLDEILKSLEDDGQMPIGFEEQFVEENHSSPIEVSSSKQKEEICNEL
jgi:tripeptide aminopeptidase